MNQRNWIFFLVILLGSVRSFATTSFSIDGHYQGKSIYVQSPVAEDGFGFCISKVTLNGEIIPVDIHASAFEIDLSQYNIKIGQEVILVFEHEEGCKPKLLNPEALRPKSTFELKDFACTSEGVLTWSTTGESGKLNFLIEQYKWNKWVVIGEVTGVGTATLNTYTFNVLPHSGENTIRLAQIDNTSKKRVTKSISFVSTINGAVEMKVITEKKTIEFVQNKVAAKTKYEIFDSYGNIVKKGYNSSVDYSNLKPGIYHINFDNKTDKFIVK